MSKIKDFYFEKLTQETDDGIADYQMEQDQQLGKDDERLQSNQRSIGRTGAARNQQEQQERRAGF